MPLETFQEAFQVFRVIKESENGIMRVRRVRNGVDYMHIQMSMARHGDQLPRRKQKMNQRIYRVYMEKDKVQQTWE